MALLGFGAAAAAKTAVGFGRKIWNWVKGNKKPLGQLGANIGTNILSRFSAKRQANLQYSKDLDMWKAQNAYNAPTMQMARLREAGLNPNLVYGSGSVVGNTSSQLPKYQAPRPQFEYQSPQLADAIGQFQNVRLQGAQIDNVQASTKVQEQTALNKAIESAILTTKNLSEKQRLKVLPQMLDYQTQKMEFDRDKAKGEAKYSGLKGRLADEGVNINDPAWLRGIINNLDVIKELFNWKNHPIIKN